VGRPDGLETVTLAEDAGISTVTLARPGARNRVNRQMVRDLLAVTEYLEEASPSSVVVLRGSETSFCGGIDWLDFESGTSSDVHDFGRWERIVAAIERLPKLSLAVIQGPCVGAGLELALACDYRLATPDAYIELPEVKSGLLPSMVTFQLAKYVSLGVAKRLLLTGQRLNAGQAESAGLIDDVVPMSDLTASIRRAIGAFQPINPTSIVRARRLLAESYVTAYEEAVGGFLAAQERSLGKDSGRDSDAGRVQAPPPLSG
jgi:enoyl-CoA hydratase/carnithine racemase